MIHKLLKEHALLRYALAIILLTHSVQSIITNDVSNFGKLFLDQIGFAPFGVYLAWAVKLSHVAAAVCLTLNKYVKWAAAASIFVFVMGIITVHYQEGWFVVGGGRNGMEYNFLLIICCITLMLPQTRLTSSGKELS
uniref:DoxX family protein n=1 Tax=Roseivirga sp. TaxID=1964215 RepID=UPI0040478078